MKARTTVTRTASRTTPPRVWQRMLSGRRLDLIDPSPVDIEIEDIAHGLARVARWNGQTTGPYAFSVAQHSLIVEDLFGQLAPPQPAAKHMMALLHDAAEYVIGDMISPFKAILGESYKDVEKRLEEAIHIRFGLRAITPRETKRWIKKADNICAWFEATQLAGFSEAEATGFFGRPPEGIHLDLHPQPPQVAQDRFIDRHSRILNEMEMEARR